MATPLLPGALDARQVATLTGFSRDSIYEHAGCDEGGWPVLRAGRRVRWATRPLLRALGLTEVAAALLLGIDAEADPRAPETSLHAVGGDGDGQEAAQPLGSLGSDSTVGRGAPEYQRAERRDHGAEVEW
jgi:hypothetical protein